MLKNDYQNFYRYFYRLICGTFLVYSWVSSGVAHGQGPQSKVTSNKGRCSVRLAIALTGNYPTPALEQATDPQTLVDDLLKQPDFIENFARFFNSKANGASGANSAEDATYHMAKHILTRGEPWKNMFVGPYDLTATGAGAAQTVTVVNNANGLGYFRNKIWMDRYAGNETAGIKLNTAYRMMNNVLGLELVATTNAPGADVSANGRQAPACRPCHYEGWHALDINSAVLSKVVRTGNNITYTPYTGPALATLGGVMVKDDGEFVKAMVESEAYLFNACRTAFSYLYGRNENQCEASLFDSCVDAFKASGMIQTALATIAKDPSFCN